MISVFPIEGLTPLTAAELFLGYQKCLREICVKSLEEARKRILETSPDLKIETTLKESRPQKTIVDMAENEGFDLIVLGSRGIEGITGWILGSKSRRVVDSCTKPVFITQ